VRGRLLELFAKNEQFPDLRGRVTRFEFGPPVGFPVQFRVIGPDTAQVREIAYRVRDTVRQSPLVRDTQLDWNEQVRAVRVQLDQDKARLLGITSADVGAMTQLVLSGAPVTQIRRGEDLIDVTLRAVPEERLALERLGDVNLFTRSGAVVPLSQVATLVPTFEEPVLWRRNRDMALTVRADVQDGVQGPAATSKIWPTLQPVVASLPPGYRIEIGGASEETAKSDRALFAVFPLMFVVMLFFLMLQLQSFSRMTMVFLTAPLALIGVVPALLIFNAPFGFVALLGVIALSGMVMRNAVILVDQIDSTSPQACRRRRGGRGHRAPLATGGADGRRRGAGHGAAGRQRVLGTDGHRHHGRADRRHGADAGLRAGAVRGVVPRGPRGRPRTHRPAFPSCNPPEGPHHATSTPLAPWRPGCGRCCQPACGLRRLQPHRPGQPGGPVDCAAHGTQAARGAGAQQRRPAGVRPHRRDAGAGRSRNRG
jgi:hypothetical protein